MESRTPAELGYHMPAEWEPHEGTWLQWPQDEVYRGYELKLEHGGAIGCVTQPQTLGKVVK
jgi:hypothetical protein